MSGQDTSDPNVDAAWVDWIRKISQGDEAALAALYSAAVGRVYGTAIRITRIPAMAEEVVEDVFFQVWRTSSSFDLNRGSPLAWLLVISRSTALKKIRSAGRIIGLDDIDPLAEQESDASTDPQSLLLTIEQNTALYRALKTLTAHERQLLELAFFKGFSYSEIGFQMKMPLGTVKTNMRRALHTLRKRLGCAERSR